MINGENLKRETFNEIMKPFGDSMVIAGSDKKVRIHIHTDEPWELFQKLHHLAPSPIKR